MTARDWEVGMHEIGVVVATVVSTFVIPISVLQNLSTSAWIGR
jgi:hypothetical protein